ncbi:hypothetical protein S40288_06684 [Stachybotrys chartarum IBT 40288]|nr:hypothetical protein S40288_06684 [Stachybotrys chartarum IBT 40288]
MSAPTILVAGATGNTGRNTVRTLSRLVQSSPALSSHKILALTRSAGGPVAQELARLPGVLVVEKNWATVTAPWLREHRVRRAFIAGAVHPAHFAEESGFQLAALRAGVEYVVRISTMAHNVSPDCAAYYARQHWAVEALLGSPEFAALRWTSLQPNAFSALVLSSAAQFVRTFRETGEQGALSLMSDEHAPVGVIDADDIGELAAHLLVQDDVDAHNHAKYVVNGPEDITGRQIVDLVEREIGTKVNEVLYRDVSFVEQMASASPDAAHLIVTIKCALEPNWEGKATAATTSKEVLAIAAPKRTPRDTFEALLQL